MAKTLQQASHRKSSIAAPSRFFGLCIALCLAILPLLASIVIFTDTHPDLKDRFDCAACRSGDTLSSADAQAAPAPALRNNAVLLPLEPVKITLYNETPGAIVRPRSPPFEIGSHQS